MSCNIKGFSLVEDPKCDNCLAYMTNPPMYGYKCGECDTTYTICASCLGLGRIGCIRCSRDKQIGICLS